MQLSFKTMKVCLWWISFTMVVTKLFSIIAVHLRGKSRPSVAIGLGCYAKVRSLCMLKPGSILLTRLVTGTLWTTLLGSLNLRPRISSLVTP